MTKALKWIWRQGIVSTFLAGLGAILPVLLTLVLIGWVGSYLHALLGPDSAAGDLFRRLGLTFVTIDNKFAAWAIGLVPVLASIWLLGLLVKSRARTLVQQAIDGAVTHIPVVKSVYGAVSQLVGMLQKDKQQELTSMNVVYCRFGTNHGGGFLALLVSPDIYRFGEMDHRVVYVPTSPIPMSGGIVFVPAENVHKVDMTAEQLMRIYFSLGIFTSQVVPEKYIQRAALPAEQSQTKENQPASDPPAE